jgi:hypothetical protein
MAAFKTFKCKYTQREVRVLGMLLDEYIRFRAQREGVEYKFKPEFFEEGILKGCKSFFHVTFSNSKLRADTKCPALFDEWRAMKERGKDYTPLL